MKAVSQTLNMNKNIIEFRSTHCQKVTHHTLNILTNGSTLRSGLLYKGTERYTDIDTYEISVFLWVGKGILLELYTNFQLNGKHFVADSQLC